MARGQGKRFHHSSSSYPSQPSRRPMFEAFSIGAWWDAEIIEKRGDTNYLVCYNGYVGDFEEKPLDLLRFQSRKAEDCDCSCLQPNIKVAVFCIHPHAFRLHSGLSQNSAWYDGKIIAKDQKTHHYACNCRYSIQLLCMGPSSQHEEAALVHVGLSKISILQVPFEADLLELSLTLPKSCQDKRQWSRDDFTSQCAPNASSEDFTSQRVSTTFIEKECVGSVESHRVSPDGDLLMHAFETTTDNGNSSMMDFRSDEGISPEWTWEADNLPDAYDVDRLIDAFDITDSDESSLGSFSSSEKRNSSDYTWGPSRLHTSYCNSGLQSGYISDEAQLGLYESQTGMDKRKCKTKDERKCKTNVVSVDSFGTKKDVNVSSCKTKDERECKTNVVSVDSFGTKKDVNIKGYSSSYLQGNEICLEETDEVIGNSSRASDTENSSGSSIILWPACKEEETPSKEKCNDSSMTEARHTKTTQNAMGYDEKKDSYGTSSKQGTSAIFRQPCKRVCPLKCLSVKNTSLNKVSLDKLYMGIVDAMREKGKTDWKRLHEVGEKDIIYEWDPLLFNHKIVSDEEDSEDEDDFDPLRHLWRDFEAALKTQSDKEPHDNVELPSCKHDFLLDEDEGYVCIHCGIVSTCMENVFWPLVNSKFYKHDNNADDKKSDEVEEDGMYDSDNLCVMPTIQGTNKRKISAWDCILGLKPLMKPHQIEGFEFLWRNLGGRLGPNDDENETAGGCIIAHAPGTGKSFLIICFLKSFLALNPWCRPLIVAPKSMLLTWQREFEKWNVGIPLYTLQSSRIRYPASVSFYMEMLSKWQKEESVLLVTYQLFSSLTDEQNARRYSYYNKVGKLLMFIPGLLILDEGHLPRNENSKIRKVLLQVHTKLRVLVSGTLFQNNLQELFNSLYLVRPRFSKSLGGASCKRQCIEGQDVTNFEEFKNRLDQRMEEENETRARKMFMEEIGNYIQKGSCADYYNFKRSRKRFREMTCSFVHLHAGDVLEKLPGLKEFTVLLKMTTLQEQLLEEGKKSCFLLNFEMECLESLVSIHPSLALECGFMKKYTQIDIERLRRLRHDYSLSAKLEFVINLAECCQMQKEKLLIFSHNIAPLNLLQECLQNKFQVFLIYGRSQAEERQKLIDAFNRGVKGTAILLASIKCCGEGVSLVRASRVVFIDMLWNPSPMKQAVSRAFRLGQDKIVYVYRLVMKRKIEEEKYVRTLQKDWLSRSIFTMEKANDEETDKGSASWSFGSGDDIMLDDIVNRDSGRYILTVLKGVSFDEFERNTT